MHTSGLGAVILASGLLFSRTVPASPVIPKAVTESALNPWVSVDASGIPVATITPVLTTINEAATTISAAPAALTATTTASQSDSTATGTTSTGGGAYEECHNQNGDFASFCTPTNGSTVYVGTTYYVTWDAQYFGEKNASIYIMADYVNTTGGPIAFQSSIQSASTGFIAWTIQKEWLQDKSSNNITLYINPINPKNGEATRFQGPSLMVTNEPPSYYRQPPTKAPTGQSLYIALPTVFGFIILCLCGGFYINRKHRKIGIGSVMGRRVGYGVGKSRSQRLGLGKKKAGAIRLQDLEINSGAQYRDAPIEGERRNRERNVGRERADSDALGSLANSPTEERTNEFRDEIRRQEQERY